MAVPARVQRSAGSNVGYAFVLTDLKRSSTPGLEVSATSQDNGAYGAAYCLMALGLGVAFYLVHDALWVTNSI